MNPIITNGIKPIVSGTLITEELIYSHHPNSKEFERLRSDFVKEKMSSSKYDELIIVTPSVFHENYEIHKMSNVSSKAKSMLELNKPILTKPTIDEVSITRYNDDKFTSLLYHTTPFGVEKTYEVKTRRDVEYNPNYIQLIVAAYITNTKGDVMLLETLPTTEGRIKGKVTFVQGHVTYTKEALFESQFKFMERSIVRELMEELTFTQEMIDNANIGEPVMHIFDANNIIGLEHFGFVYNVQVSDEVFEQLQSNEPDAHKVSIFRNGTSFENDSHYEKFDHWVKLASKYL